MCPIYKKRRLKMCTNCHDISFLNMVCKYSQLYCFKDYNPLLGQVMGIIGVGLGLESLLQAITVSLREVLPKMREYGS